MKTINGYCMLPHLTLSACSVVDRMRLNIGSRKGGVPLTVKIPDGNILSLEADYKDSVFDLKRFIAAQTGFQVERQQLIFAGKFLWDHRPMVDYSVSKGSTLILLLKDWQGTKTNFFE